MSSSSSANKVHSIDVDDYEPQDDNGSIKVSLQPEERDEATLHEEEEEEGSLASGVSHAHHQSHARATQGSYEEYRTRHALYSMPRPMELDHGSEQQYSSYVSSNQHYQDHREIFYDEDDDDEKLTCWNWGWFWCLFWLAVLALTVGVSCLMNGCNASSDPIKAQPAHPLGTVASPAQNPTMAPPVAALFTLAPTPEPLLIQSLPAWSLQALKDSASPQAQAYRWVAKDPGLAQYSNARRIQRFALATLYYATQGVHWVDQNWLLYETDECTWFTNTDARVYPEYETDYGSYPCSSESEYMFLTPWNIAMSGTLPPELGLLTKLQVLDLTAGTIGGTLPTELGLLTNLRKMWLSALQLTGTIPTALFGLTNLEGLGLYTNKLSGSLPSEMGLVTKLQVLELYGNELQGSLFSEIGLLTNLEDFQIDNNRLTNVIPTEIGLAKALSTINAYENQFRGPIPTEFGQLENLTRLVLSDNFLTSILPPQLQKLESLQGLLVARNFLQGQVNSFSFASKKLRFLHLEGNHLLVGTFPQYLCLLQEGLQFDCNRTHLCGCQCACQNNTGENGGGR